MKMAKVINFSEYMQRGNLLDSVMQGEAMKEPLAAYCLTKQLHNNGLKNAQVYHENNYYVVVFNLPVFDYCCAFLKGELKAWQQLSEGILKREDPNTQEIWFFRNFPTRKQIRLILKKVGREDLL